jgi:hypothetical protein
VPHPCFEAPHATWTTTEPGQLGRTITGYFDEGFWRSTNAEGIRGKVGAYHRTLATYLNLLLAMGFRLDRVEEPHFSVPAVERVPSYGVLPTILLMRARRGGSGAIIPERWG